ncbi:MAG: hypothetical protein ACK53Y_27540, partial [bacterium]
APLQQQPGRKAPLQQQPRWKQELEQQQAGRQAFQQGRKRQALQQGRKAFPQKLNIDTYLNLFKLPLLTITTLLKLAAFTLFTQIHPFVIIAKSLKVWTITRGKYRGS